MSSSPLASSNGDAGAASAAPALSAWKDEDVLAWVSRQRVKGMLRDEIMAASKSGLDGWPLVGRHLPQNAVDRCIAILEDRASTGRQRPAGGSMKKDAGKRLHELYAKRRKAGDELDRELYQARIEIIQLAGLLESIDFPGLGIRDATQDMLADIHADMTRAATWLDASFGVVNSHMDQLHIIERIRRLREDNWGRTGPEIETAHRLANVLESKLHAKQLNA